MKEQEIRVSFQPTGRGVFVLPGTTVMEAAARAGIVLQMPCGGEGTCGKCRVKIVSGRVRSRPAKNAIPARLAGQGYCLACRTEILERLVVEIPDESLFEADQRILVEDEGIKGEIRPAIRKQFFRMSPPSREDGRSDTARLVEALGGIKAPPWLIASLPGFLRKNDWSGTAAIGGGELMALEAGDTLESLHGLAFDIGTTTVVGTLIDLRRGAELAVASRLNAQVPYGDDVISRIKLIRERPDALQLLQELIIGTVKEIVADLVNRSGIAADRIYDMTIAGNSTMQHIFCGIDPSALGEMPFVQAFHEALALPAADLGIGIHPAAQVMVFPQIESFIGGDTVAGMLASRIDAWEKPLLFIDIGTNGELALAHAGTLLAASTAAGPAFEGARIVQGMRAAAGAIEKVVISDDVVINVIDNVAPVGICGTALIDAVAGLLDAGVLDETGRILSPGELPASVPGAIRDRIVPDDGQGSFVLCSAGESGTGEALRLWQKDIRELQLASGAIRAGIAILLKKAGLRADDLGTVLLAGAFGNYIRRENARRIGLLPPLPLERIKFIGNAASLGAKLALLSEKARKYAGDLAAKTEHVDLSNDPEFQLEFSSAMMFPEQEQEPRT